ERLAPRPQLHVRVGVGGAQPRVRPQREEHTGCTRSRRGEPRPQEPNRSHRLMVDARSAEEQIVCTSKRGKPGTPRKSGKSGKSGKPGKPGKPGRSGKPGKPRLAGSGRATGGRLKVPNTTASVAFVAICGASPRCSTPIGTGQKACSLLAPC